MSLAAPAIPDYLLSREQARRNERVVQLAALLIGAVAIALAGWLLPGLNSERKARGFVIDPDTIKGLPPEVILARQTGALRGYLIVRLSERSTRFKEQGKSYDAAQTASWICRLLPNFPAVWSHHAWDQAYNISVQRYSPEERWKWVSNGIRLLRDEGIPYNPKAIKLYKELAWLYYHKIGDRLDDHHLFYKRELAVEMERVLGPPPTALSADDVLAAFKPIADAPGDVESLVQQDPQVQQLVEQLRALDLRPDKVLLEFVARNLRTQLQLSSLLKEPPQNAAEQLRQKRIALLTDEQLRPAVDRLLACVRSKVLREEFKLDPNRMYECMEEFGPFDWRSPFAIGLYWSWLGDIVTVGHIRTSNDANDSMNTVRNIFFCLGNLVQQGKLVLEPNWERPNASALDPMPDLRYVDRLHRAFLEYGEAQFKDDPEFRPNTAGPNYKAGHVNFIESAIALLYLSGESGNIAKAEEYLDYLRKFNPEPDGRTIQSRYMVPLKEFVMKDLLTRLDTYKMALPAIGNTLGLAIVLAGQDQVAEATARVKTAGEMWEYYMKDLKSDRIDRRKMDPLPYLYADAAKAFLSADGVDIIYQVRAWEKLQRPLAEALPEWEGPTTQQIIYDDLRDYFVARCEAHDPPLDVSKAFPEPAGMDDYRQNPIQRAKTMDEDVSEGERDFTP